MCSHISFLTISRDGISLPWKVVNPSWPLLVSWLHFSPILRLAPSILYLPPICTHTRNFNLSLSVGAFSLIYKQVQNSLKDIISDKLLSYNSISRLPASSKSPKSSLYFFLFHLIICSVYILLVCGWVPYHTKKKIDLLNFTNDFLVSKPNDLF